MPQWPDQLTDRALIRRVCGGCQAAADELCRRCRPLIAGLALRRFDLPPDQVDDVVNQVFLKLWADDCRALRAWRGQARFSSYLGAIVIHHCQRLSRQVGREQSMRGERTAHVDGQPRPDESVEWIQNCERMNAAIRGLSDRDRLLLALRYREERSPVEIAELLQINAGTARKALHDALARLRKRLGAAPAAERERNV